MKKYIFIAITAIIMVACANKKTDEIAKVAESSKMTECNISVGGLHFTNLELSVTIAISSAL